MKSVRQILDAKGYEIWTTTPQTRVFDALGIMAEKNVGALPVLESDRLVGIFSERDYARKVILKGKSSKELLVREIMTAEPVTVTLDRTLEECMELMTDKRIRHLPVMEAERLIGVVSIGDIVKEIIDEQKSTIHDLESYITGRR